MFICDLTCINHRYFRHEYLTIIMLWESFSILMSLLSHSVCGKHLHVCNSCLYCRSHKLPVHLGLTACYVILTGLRCSLVLAVLSGNFWVWISLGVGVGSGYLLIRPCFISATSEVSGEEDINGQGRVRLKTVRKTGHYSIPKTARHSQSVPESTQIEYYIQTTENNNNNNNNHSTDDTDKQTHPLLHTAPQSEEKTILQQESTCTSTTFLPSAQPTIQSMSNEERWDYIRETFQKLSRSHLYAGIQERRRMQDQSYLPCQSPRIASHSQYESSFDASTVDFNDLLNEDSYRTQESAQPWAW